jgi:transcriptional regulator with XRE-family HTH domain
MVHHVIPTTEPATALGAIIEQRRLELGLTKSEAARLAGVSRGTWHEVEAGRRSNMLANTLNLFDKALGWERGRLHELTRPLEGRPDLVATEGRHSAVDGGDERQRLASLLVSMPVERVEQLLKLLETDEQKTGDPPASVLLVEVKEMLGEVLRRLEDRTTPAHGQRRRPASGEHPPP